MHTRVSGIRSTLRHFRCALAVCAATPVLPCVRLLCHMMSVVRRGVSVACLQSAPHRLCRRSRAHTVPVAERCSRGKYCRSMCHGCYYHTRAVLHGESSKRLATPRNTGLCTWCCRGHNHTVGKLTNTHRIAQLGWLLCYRPRCSTGSIDRCTFSRVSAVRAYLAPAVLQISSYTASFAVKQHSCTFDCGQSVM